jgi:hypothetical protein
MVLILFVATLSFRGVAHDPWLGQRYRNKSDCPLVV